MWPRVSLLFCFIELPYIFISYTKQSNILNDCNANSEESNNNPVWILTN